jgi:uncharacterized membrane protein YphA (DoxX/SURF4 family)
VNIKPRDVIALVSRVVVGGVLLYAGFLKAAGPAAEFAAAIMAYNIVPSSLASPLALIIPYLEMWVGLFMLTGFYTRYAALAAAILFTIFLGALGSTLVRGIDLVSCGCFGADTLSPHRTLVMDMVLLALSVTTNRLSRYPLRWSLDQALL